MILMHLNSIKLFRTKTKPSWASRCTSVYTDHAGRVYYKYNDELDMCVIRKGEIDKCLMELSYGRDYLDVFKGIKDMLGETDKRGNIKPNLSSVGYLAEEVLVRDKYLIIPDILMKVCANTLVREDENPLIVDAEILDQKIATFKAEIQRGGLRDFFYSAGTLKLLELSSMSTTEFNSHMLASEVMQERHEQIRASIFGNT